MLFRKQGNLKLMGKDKLKRFSELLSFENVLQPQLENLESSIKTNGEWKNIFNNENPIILELGCGKGEYTVGLAKINTHNNYIGVDIKGSRIWRGAKTCIEKNIENVRFLRTKVDFIDLFFNNNEVAEIWLTFSDPQPKKPRKRLTSPLFIERYKKFLKEGGIIHLKTDSTLLYEYTLEQISEKGYQLIEKSNDVYNELIQRTTFEVKNVLEIKTFYEKMWLKEGKKIKYLSFSVS